MRRLLPLLALAALLLVALATPAQAAPLSALFLGLKAFAGTTLGGLVLRVAAGVLPSLLARALAPKARQPGVRIEGTTGGEEIPQSFPIGRRAVGGHLRYHNSHATGGTPNEFYTMVISVSDSPGVALRRLRVGDKYTALGDTLHPRYGAPMLQFRHEGQDNGWIRFHDGTQTAADPDLVAVYGADPDQPWTENHIGQGVAYAIITLRLNREVWQGVPPFRFILDGIPLYDPRKDSTVGGSGAHRWNNPATWERSENLALMVYNILRGIPLPDGNIYGGQVAAEDLPLSNWIAGMNVCDVELGGRRQFTGGLEVLVDQEPAEVIEELLKAGLGQITETGGVFRTRWGAPDLPVYTFTDDDIAISAPQQYDPFPGLQGTHNAIRVTHPSAANLWEPVQTPLITNAEWEAADAGRRLTTLLSTAACFNHGQAQQIARAYIEDARRFRTHTLVLPADAQRLEPLDTVEWTSARNGYVAKLFEVVQVEYLPFSLLVGLTLRERDPDDYDWSPDLELAPPPELAPTPVDPREIGGANWTVTGAVVEDALGEPRRPALSIDWLPEAVSDARALRYQVRVAETYELVTQGRATPADGQVRVSEGILAATQYSVRLRPALDRPSEWTAPKLATTPDVRLTAADIAPGEIRELFEEAGISPIRIVSELPATGELDELVWLRPENRLYRWDGAAWVTAAPGEFSWEDFPEDARPIRVVDELPTTGEQNELVFLTTESRLYRWNGTAWERIGVDAEDIDGELVEEQIADGIINTAKFAAGLRPVEIVSALPGTPHIQGRTVLLTTDNKLYRNTGSGWTAAVPAADISGQVAAAQIAALEAAKITGQLSNAQIAALAAAKLTGQIVGTQITDNAITTPKIATGAVTANEVAANAIVADKIASNAVTAVKIQAGAVEAAKIAAGAVEADKIAAGAVTADKVAANAITADKIVSNAISTAKIAAGAVTATEIAAGAITASKITISNGTNLVPDPNFTDLNSWTASAGTIQTSSGWGIHGDATLLRVEKASSGTVWVRSGWIPAAPGDAYQFSVICRIVSGTGDLRGQLVPTDRNFTDLGTVNTPTNTTSSSTILTGNHIMPANTAYVRFQFRVSDWVTVAFFGGPKIIRRATGELIVDGTITATQIAANTITATQLAANTITAAQIAAGTITGDRIAAATITGNRIAANTITATQIAANTITAVEIAAGAITADRLNVGTVRAALVGAHALVAENIAAGAISARQISIGDFTNLNPDRDYQDPALWSGATGFYNTTAPVWRSNRVLMLAGPPESYAFVQGPGFAVQEGEELFIRMRSYTVGGNGTVGMSIAFSESPDFTNITYTWPTGLTHGNSGVTETSGVTTVPAGMKWARPRLTKINNGAAEVRFGLIEIRRRAVGELIVNGAITADKLTTGEVITSSAQIRDATITSAKIGDTIQSNNFLQGSRGWRITKTGGSNNAGTAEFNDLIARGSLQVGSASDVERWVDLNTQRLDNTSWTNITTLTLGALEAGEFWNVLASAELRARAINSNGTGGNVAAEFRVQKRLEIDGVWGTFSEVAFMTSGNGHQDWVTPGAWSEIMAGVFSNVQYRIQWRTNGTASQLGPNFRRRFLAARRLMR